MKQSERLDLILKELYSRFKTTGNIRSTDIECLLREKSIVISRDEAHILGTRLQQEGLVNGASTKCGFSLRLTSYGIEYCEESSFSKKGTPVSALILNIADSPGTTIVHSSSNVNISQSSTEIIDILNKIYAAIQVSSEVDEEIQNESLGRLNEIKNYIEATQKVPKFSLNDFLSFSSNISSVASLVISLQQMQ